MSEKEELEEVMREYEHQSRDLERKEEEISLLYETHGKEMSVLKREYQQEIKSLRQDVELSSTYSQELESNFRELLEENRKLRSKIDKLGKKNSKLEKDKTRMGEENEEIRQYFLNSVSRLSDLEETIKRNEIAKNGYISELEDTLRSERLKTMGYIEQISQLITVIQDVNLFREKKEDFKRIQVTDMIGEVFKKKEQMEELLMIAKQIVVNHKKPTFRKRRLLEMNAINKCIQRFQLFFKQIEMYNEVMNLRLKLRESYSKNHDLSMILKRMSGQLIKSESENSNRKFKQVIGKRKSLKLPKPIFHNTSKRDELSNL